MDPQQNNSSLNLPPIGQQDLGQLASSSPAADPAPAQQALIATNPLPTSVSSDAVVPQQQTGGSQGPGLAPTPASADDVDLIEKEWIVKIEEIIHHTTADPYERSRQMALLKAEYLQKRYNRTINANQ